MSAKAHTTTSAYVSNLAVESSPGRSTVTMLIVAVAVYTAVAATFLRAELRGLAGAPVAPDSAASTRTAVNRRLTEGRVRLRGATRGSSDRLLG